MNLNWDSDNKLRSADIDANGTADVNFQYDALGRRVARSGTGGTVVFVQMDQQTIADYPVGGAATTPTFRYVYASYIDEPVVRKTAGTGGTLVYFHRNQQYSITAVTTSTGSIAERYAYSAYGQPTILDASASVLSSSAINNRYTYTGREWDATLRLHHFRARWMSPSAGRFLTRDPMGFNGSEFNLYEYCSGNPPITTDPLGLFSLVDPWIPQSQIVKAALYAALVAQCQNCDSSDNARTTRSACTYADCVMAASKLSQAISNTILWNAKPRKFFDGDKKYGYFCYQWAWGFRGVFNAVDTNQCFTTVTQESRGPGWRIHEWLEIKCKCGGAPVYLDDGYGKGLNWVYSNKPLAGYKLAPFGGNDCRKDPYSLDPETKCEPVTPYDENGKPVDKPFYYD
jgi:RHS repeat-associated protein